jgi:Nif11 domain
MSEIDAQRFRQKAEECLSLAEKAANPVDKEAWSKLATEWLTLAEATERQ